MKLVDLTAATIQQQVQLHAAKVDQFNLVPLLQDEKRLDSFSDITEEMRQLGIWAVQGPTKVLEAIRVHQPFFVLVGFRPSRFHLGHITLARELAWYMRRGAVPVFIVSGYEANTVLTNEDARKKVAEFWQIVTSIYGQMIPQPQHIYSDKETLEIRVLEDQVGEFISVQKILQLYGWENSVSVTALRITTMTAAAFLFPQSLNRTFPTIVLSDINQVTHAEVAKIAARKLNLVPPMYSYRTLLPSLLGPDQRMSVKNPNSAIFLDEGTDVISSKLKKCFSGGRKTPEEQREKGGNPLICSFFKVSRLLLPQEQTTEMLRKCVSGDTLCGHCKLEFVEPAVRCLSAMILRQPRIETL